MNETIADSNLRLAKLQSSRNIKLNKEVKEIKEKLDNEKKSHQEAVKALQVENNRLQEKIAALEGKNWNYETQLERSKVKKNKLNYITTI